MSNLGDYRAFGLRQDNCTPAQDLAAWDQLGPRTRQVLNDEMLVQWSATEVLRRAHRLGDPLHPAIDRRMAQYLREVNAKIRERFRAEMK